jgi:2'-5' RNA ligase
LHSTEQFRFFIALSLPDGVRNSIERVQADLRRVLPEKAARWTRREQFHLTLRFLGNVAATRVDELVKVTRTACGRFCALRLTAARLGFFPQARSPRVLWVGVKDLDDRLGSLWAALQSATLPFTTEPAEANFTGHITLARLNRLARPQTDDLAKATAKYDKTVFGDWTADRLELVRSELLPQGACHSLLAELPFGQGRDQALSG